MCPNSHELCKYKTPHGKHSCDVRELPVAVHELIQRCEDCDYDMCCVCAAPMKHAEAPTKHAEAPTKVPTELPTDSPTELLTDMPTELTDVQINEVDNKTFGTHNLDSPADLADEQAVADPKPMDMPTHMTRADVLLRHITAPKNEAKLKELLVRVT